MRQAPEDLAIRPMASEDVSSVGNLCKELGFSGQEVEFKARFERLQNFPAHESFVATMASRGIVGWVHVFEAPSLLSVPSAEIGGMVVEPSHRRRGIGAALMEEAQAWAKARGCESVLLATQVKRIDAQEFYRSLGYETEFATYFMRKRLSE